MKNIAQNSANLGYATQMLQQSVGRFTIHAGAVPQKALS
jgi:hypothetical protein